jgi:hypothetical protein
MFRLGLRRVLRQAEASDAGATALGGKLTLNFAVPHAGIYDKRSVCPHLSLSVSHGALAALTTIFVA